VSSECDRFGRYLIGASPPAYVRDWYEDGLARFPDRFTAVSRMDRVLLSMSRWLWFPTRSVDMAARFIAPGGAVRRRLVFLTAVLENAPGSFEKYEIPEVRSRWGFFVGLAGRGVVSGMALVAGLIAAGIAYAGGGGR
jgi:hypothetical protein